MNSFLIVAFGVWVAAMAAWFMVSKYVKSADVDKVKARLLGTGKARPTTKKGAKGEKSIFTPVDTSKHRFAQLLVEKYQLGPKLQAFLEQSGLPWTPAHLVNATLMAYAGGAAFAWFVLPSVKSLALLIGVGTGSLPPLFVYRKRMLRLRRFEEIFPDTLEFMSRSMRAGHAFSVSLEMIQREFPEPVAGEFRRTFEEHNLGLPIDVALQKLATRVPSLDVHFFVSAVLLQKRTGGNLAEILDKLAYVIRERFKLRGRIRAVSAHGKMTATALSCIPIATAVLMFYTNPDYVKFFFTDDAGNIMAMIAIALQIIGYFIMKQIVKIEV
jgi:tight adherence protein B